jgi:hypothetical protein
MLIPTTYLAAVILLAVAVLCQGSWAAFYRLAAKSRRAEWFLVDCGLGFGLGALVLCFTAGSFDGTEITFTDTFVGMALRKVAWSFGAGTALALAAAFLLAAASVAGVSFTFPAAMSAGALVILGWTFFQAPQANLGLRVGGGLAAVVGWILTFSASSLHWHRKGGLEAEAADPKFRRAILRRATSQHIKGVVLTILGGLFLGGFVPLALQARQGDLGIPAYPFLALAAAALVPTCVIVALILVNLAVTGEPVEMTSYFRGGGLGPHLWGWVSGALLAGGVLAQHLTITLPTSVLTAEAAWAIGHAGFLLHTLWGLGPGREFRDSSGRVRALLWFATLTAAAATGMIFLAALYK